MAARSKRRRWAAEKAEALHGECQEQRKPKKNGRKATKNFNNNATADRAADVKHSRSCAMPDAEVDPNPPPRWARQ